MDASYKIQRGIHVHLIQFFMCPEFWVHIIMGLRFCYYRIVSVVSECFGYCIRSTVGCTEVVPQGTFSCGVAAIHLVAPYGKPLYYISRNEKMENG